MNGHWAVRATHQHKNPIITAQLVRAVMHDEHPHTESDDSFVCPPHNAASNFYSPTTKRQCPFSSHLISKRIRGHLADDVIVWVVLFSHHCWATQHFMLPLRSQQYALQHEQETVTLTLTMTHLRTDASLCQPQRKLSIRLSEQLCPSL